MKRVGLKPWLAAFQKNLPQNCTSIARVRETTPEDLKTLGFKLTAAHVSSVLRALRKEPLAMELGSATARLSPVSAEPQPRTFWLDPRCWRQNQLTGDVNPPWGELTRVSSDEDDDNDHGAKPESESASGETGGKNEPEPKAEALKERLEKAGLEAWHGHLTKHLNIKTVAELEAITAVDLKRMAVKANMRLDVKTTGTVLKAIKAASRLVLFTPQDLSPGANLDMLVAANCGDLVGTQRSRQAGGRLDFVDVEFGFCALTWACQQGHTLVAEFLLSEGCDVNAASSHANAADLEGSTALMRASRQGHTSLVTLLLEHKADMEMTQHIGLSALMYAVEQDHLPVVQALVHAGANIRLNNPEPHFTALMRAAADGYLRILQFLIACDHSEVDAVDA